MAGLLEGKNGLITGGGSGMGRSAAIIFAREGAKVVISGRTEAKLLKTKEAVEAEGGVCEIVTGDISREEDAKRMVDAVVEKFGRIDFAVNAASIETSKAPIWELEREKFDEVMDIDFWGTFYCLKHEAAYMVKQGAGSIVNITSGAGELGCYTMTPYAAAKAGVNNMTKSAALDCGEHNVRVNAILPGMTETEMIKAFHSHFPAIYAQMESQIPMGRLNTPEEQANVCLFLCSDLSEGVNGALINTDCGYMAGRYQRTK